MGWTRPLSKWASQPAEEIICPNHKTNQNQRFSSSIGEIHRKDTISEVKWCWLMEVDDGFEYWCAVRRRLGPEAPFFAHGNIERELLAKQIALDFTEHEKQQLDLGSRELFCPIVGCGAYLRSLEDFEDHYNARHTASCSVCSRVYPTSRLLGIHISEAHDSFFQAKVARGYPMYECLVEGCGLKLKSYKSRHQHLVDKHKFPSSFEFLKKAHPSKKWRQKSHRKPPHKKAETSSNMQVEDATKKQGEKNQHGEDDNSDEASSCAMQVEEETMDGLVSAVSKLSTSDFSPTAISFGRRHARAFGFVPRAVQRGKKSEPETAGAKR